MHILQLNSTPLHDKLFAHAFITIRYENDDKTDFKKVVYNSNDAYYTYANVQCTNFYAFHNIATLSNYTSSTDRAALQNTYECLVIVVIQRS